CAREFCSGIYCYVGVPNSEWYFDLW
nr:immunoglobulin heavy chain junction region [Macaca mulatta]MOW77862.1 immunoglobulin heavy chain junction region [Macaca mulatta]MOW78315.1 immunoglobulin heavy chain junction region [Macaca mulatta]MOW80680.1 immunoglobulin heavy chain junction region [Macaca mulatta]MOW81022.1 immunoglobulin heavy chain junction region [Macaca mulatta]